MDKWWTSGGQVSGQVVDKFEGETREYGELAHSFDHKKVKDAKSVKKLLRENGYHETQRNVFFCSHQYEAK